MLANAEIRATQGGKSRTANQGALLPRNTASPFCWCWGEISSLTKKNKWCGNSWEIHGGLRVKPSEGDTSDGQRSPFGRGKPCLGSAFPMSAHHCCYCTMAGYDWLPLFTRFLGEHMLVWKESRNLHQILAEAPRICRICVQTFARLWHWRRDASKLWGGMLGFGVLNFGCTQAATFSIAHSWLKSLQTKCCIAVFQSEVIKRGNED